MTQAICGRPVTETRAWAANLRGRVQSAAITSWRKTDCSGFSTNGLTRELIHLPTRQAVDATPSQRSVLTARTKTEIVTPPGEFFSSLPPHRGTRNCRVAVLNTARSAYWLGARHGRRYLIRRPKSSPVFSSPALLARSTSSENRRPSRSPKARRMFTHFLARYHGLTVIQCSLAPKE